MLEHGEAGLCESRPGMRRNGTWRGGSANLEQVFLAGDAGFERIPIAVIVTADVGRDGQANRDHPTAWIQSSRHGA
ncbi:hypothetical protein [Polymorphospora sp. NPDC050346]|uniref:hypothetical protein n=1 Tax=Polymorphospora sp. NPDC050346 TaxID=3155780 RepID=UPI0033DB09D1